MINFRKRRFWLIGSLLAYAALALAFSAARSASATQPSSTAGAIGVAAFSEPTTSSPIALSADKRQLWVVNPDSDTVSVFDVSSTNPAAHQLLRSIQVGDEPQSIALDTISATSYNAYIANAAGSSVTVLNVSTSGTFSATFDKELVTGAEPWNVVASPDGRRVFVANSGQDTITVIRTDTRQIVGSVNIRNSACNVGDAARHFQPRGLAVTLDNTKLYVTRFLSFTRAGGVQATDTGKEGIVCRIDLPATITTLPSTFTPISLAPQVTGFQIDSNGDGVADDTSAYPNQLQSIAIHGDRAYLPNIAASPSGPLKFNVDTQAFVNSITGVTGASQADANAINLHLGARDPELVGGAAKTKLFFANPWAIAFANLGGQDSAYVVSAGSDLLVKLNLDGAGAPSFTVDANTTRYIDLHDPANPATSGANAGKNPLGIVTRNNGPGDNFAFVMNYVSRNVSVVNLDTDSVARVITSSQPPIAGSQDEQLHVGKEIFFASRGVFDGGKTNRLSSEGWQNCASCHFAGLTDGNVWSFNAGPRKSVPLNGTWNPHNPDDQRVLNYSAIFDEVQDFEANIRNVSGPGNLPAPAPANTLDPNHGLLIGDNGDINAAPSVVNAFAKPNAARPQLTVTLPGSSTAWPALDAMSEWVRFAVRTPNGPLDDTQISLANGAISQSTINAGRTLFFQARCQTCHGGGKWSNSSKDFLSPPPGTELATEVAGALPPPGGSPAPPAGVNPVAAQFLFNKLQNIDSFNLGVAPSTFGGGVGAVEKATDGRDALGKDHNADGRGNGYNVPSLLGIWSLPPYYHNGSCETLVCVVNNQAHRTVRGTLTDVLNTQTKRDQVVTFLQSLDANTKPVTNLYVRSHDLFLEPAAPIAGDPVTPGANLSIFGPNIDFNALIGKPITVRFSISRAGTNTPLNSQNVTIAAFTKDFGQEVLKANPFTLPNQPGAYTLEVAVDSGNDFAEDRENDNVARRTFQVRPIPADKTAPEITTTAINNDAAVVTSRDVTITFNASDPTSPAGQSTSGLASFCVVRYYYDGVQRRWVEENCNFKALPAAAGNGSFSVPARLPDRAGVAYAFVWVKDKAGNISKTPGFDFTNFIPSGARNINRNDTRVFRIRVAPGQSISLTFTPTIGDVDATVFQGITNPVRCDTSAIQNGTVAETVSVPSGSCTGTDFQIEVRAVVNSRFSISTNLALASAAQRSSAAAAPEAVLPDDTALVAGPPATQAAIDGGAPIFLPFLNR